MSLKDVWCCVAVGIVVAVDEPDDESATLKVEHMFERGELTDRIITSIREGNMTLEIDEVEELES